MGRLIHRDTHPSDLLEETLAGVHGAQAVRRVALDPRRHGARDVLADLVPDWEGSSPRLIRTKYKPSRKLTATYTLTSDDPARHLTVIWTNEAVRAFVSPADPDMPQLAGLHDRDRLTELLGFAGRIDTIRYRPGQRHVLRVSAPDRSAYAKIDRDDSGARAVPVAQALQSRLAARCPRAKVVEPIGYSAADRAGLWHGAPGEALWQRFTGGVSAAAGMTHLVGRAIRVLHDTPLDALPAHDAPARDAAAEMAATARAGEHLVALLPEVGADYLAIVEDVADELGRIPTEAPTFTHGDVKSDNVLAFGEQVRLLDLDRCGPADPALDLAKLIADLRWWSGDGGDLSRTLISAFHDGYGECDEARWERATHLSQLFHLKLAARRCAVHDPSWEADVRARVSAAAPVLVRGA